MDRAGGFAADSSQARQTSGSASDLWAAQADLQSISHNSDKIPEAMQKNCRQRLRFRRQLRFRVGTNGTSVVSSPTDRGGLRV
jgi:hypothetical protein